MKKIAMALMATIAFAASAADYASVAIDHVTNRKDDSRSTVEYVRAGKEINGLQFGVQSRTARADDATSLKHSLEATVGKNLQVAGFTVTPFVGAGRDQSKNGASEPFTYGLVGASAGTSALGGYVSTGLKTRVGSTESGDRTKQTLISAQYAYPVAKQVALTAGISRSSQDIKERAFGVGVSVGF